MAKWEHWFWVTFLWIFLLLVESRFCQQSESTATSSNGRHLNDFIDTLTAPTLKPEGAKVVRAASNAKLTIITPSSVVAVSTAQPFTSTASTTYTPTVTHTTGSLTTKVPLAENNEDEAKEVIVANRGHRDNVTVSHSVSVVSVKYSFDESRGGGGASSSEEDTIGITTSKSFSSDSKEQNQNSDHQNNAEVSNPEEHQGEFEAASKLSTLASDYSGLTNDSNNLSLRDRAPKSIVSVTTIRPQEDKKIFIQLSDTSSTTSATTYTTSTTTTMSPRISTADSNSFVTVTSVTRSFHERMKYDHHLLVEEPPTTLQPQSTSVSVTSKADDAIVLNEEEDKGIPDGGLIDRGHGSGGGGGSGSLQHNREQEEEPEGIRSETARALNELGFTYNEYIDDSDLLGDDSNDEVIPAFHEENYRQQESEFHAIPSKSELASEAVLLQQESVHHPGDLAGNLNSINSRQGKKAPLPHEHEPHTIVGITVGAFLLIFIGTVGLGAFIYHERYANKPHTLDDRYANSESGGCSTSVDDSIGRISYVECSGLDNPRDTYCEEMYNLDNDSFLNSLETVAMPTMLWSVSPHSDSDV